MNRIKKIVIVGISLSILLLALVVANATEGNQFTVLGKLFGSKAEIYQEEDTSKILASINGKNITENEVNRYINAYGIFNIKKNKSDIIEKIAIDILLIKEANKHNIFVDDETVREQLNLQMKNLRRDPKGYEQYKEFIDSAGITEEEYIELVEPVHKKLLTIGAYKNQILKPKFKENNNILSDNELHNAFEDYYNNSFKTELLNNAEIEYFE